MNEQEILDFNKICAEFIGWKIEDIPEGFGGGKGWFENGVYQCEVGLEMFNEDWNWIMSLLEKISSLNEDDFSDETQQAFEDLLDLSLFSSKESVCKSINNFIKTEATKQQNNFLMKNYQKNH